MVSEVFHIKPDAVDLDRLRKEVMDIVDNCMHEGQIMVQGIQGKNHLYGTGSLLDYPETEEQFVHPVWEDAKYLNQVVEELGMYRSRIMIRRKSVYTWHCDPTPRLHIPIVTNPETNFMVIEDTVVRMPANGSVYWTDTRLMHTFVNTEKEDRIHIVGCIKE